MFIYYTEYYFSIAQLINGISSSPIFFLIHSTIARHFSYSLYRVGDSSSIKTSCSDINASVLTIQIEITFFFFEIILLNINYSSKK